MCRIQLTTIQYIELPEVVQKLETIILTCLEHTLASVAHWDNIKGGAPESRQLAYWSRCKLNTLRPRQNRRHFPDDIFKCIFLNENVWISINISLKFVHKGLIDHIPALVQIMAWRRPGDKPLSEPMMISLPMHLCVTRPQWVKEEDWIIDIWKLMMKFIEWLINNLLINECTVII